jgi:UDP-N-acetylglucosamine 2-epimerase (non-hydrolysing)
MKTICVIGTRPEAIKMAPIVKCLEERPDRVANKVVVTSQHRELQDDVLKVFGIAPDYDLQVMTGEQTPSQVAAAVLGRLEPVLETERPDWLLVQGDTTTTMAAAIAASYARTNVAHVEAGLRTYDRRQPFPEELNRCVVSTVADLHFAPTAHARQNLAAEGIATDRIRVTGNPVIDALRWSARQADLQGSVNVVPDRPSARLVLLTAHRRENFGRGLEGICQAVRDICERYRDRVHFVYPVHPNPNVAGPASLMLGNVPQVTLLPPVGYLAFVQLMARAHLVLTDSGGIQEEAPSLGKPVLVLREVTERPEAVSAGTVRLVGTNASAIVESFVELWENPAAYDRMARAKNPYGDGRAAERIVKILLEEPVEEFCAGSVELT